MLKPEVLWFLWLSKSEEGVCWTSTLQSTMQWWKIIQIKSNGVNFDCIFTSGWMLNILCDLHLDVVRIGQVIWGRRGSYEDCFISIKYSMLDGEVQWIIPAKALPAGASFYSIRYVGRIAIISTETLYVLHQIHFNEWVFFSSSIGIGY